MNYSQNQRIFVQYLLNNLLIDNHSSISISQYYSRVCQFLSSIISYLDRLLLHLIALIRLDIFSKTNTKINGSKCIQLLNIFCSQCSIDCFVQKWLACIPFNGIFRFICTRKFFNELELFFIILFLVEKSLARINCLLVCPQGPKNISPKKSIFLLNDGSELGRISTNRFSGVGGNSANQISLTRNSVHEGYS